MSVKYIDGDMSQLVDLLGVVARCFYFVPIVMNSYGALNRMYGIAIPHCFCARCLSGVGYLPIIDLCVMGRIICFGKSNGASVISRKRGG